MPRGSNMSVARFCDWTEDKSDCYSVSRLYREIAGVPQSQSNGSTTNVNKSKICLSIASSSSGASSSALLPNAPNRSAFNNPGRMFVRDKKALTRGEREIIEGIYKNRSDVNAKDAIANLNYHVKSHQEAWQIGKLYVKNERSDVKLLIKSSGQQQQQQQQQQKQHQEHQNAGDTNTDNNGNDDLKPLTGKYVQTDSRNNTSIPLSGRLGNKFASTRKLMETSPFPKCTQCQLEQRGVANQDLAKRAYLAHQHNQDNHWDSRPCAPPSTPDRPCATGNSFHFGHRQSFEKGAHSNHNNGSEETSPAQVTVVDSSDSLSPCSNRSPSGRDRNNSPRREGNTNSNQRCSSKIQKTINIIHSVLEENTKTSSSGKQNSASSGFHSNECLQDFENCSESGSDSESKRVKVKVYLPVADKDEHEDVVSESGIDASSVTESVGRCVSHCGVNTVIEDLRRQN